MHDESGVLGERNMKKERMIGKGTAAVLLSTALLTGCGNSLAAEEQEQLKSKGMEQALAGEYEEAVASYEEALHLSDMHVGSLELDIAAYKASAQHRSGKTSDAIETCNAILDLKPSAKIYLTRGLLYREMENTEAAKADFEQAMKLVSKKDQLLLGRLSYYMEDYANARIYLEEATKAGDPEGIYWQAELYREMGNTDYAVTLYQNYLEGGDVKHQDAYEQVASYQISQEDYSEALKTLEAGIALGDQGVQKELLALEIVAYERQSDFAAAKQKMESFLELYPEEEAAQREYLFLKTRS